MAGDKEVQKKDKEFRNREEDRIRSSTLSSNYGGNRPEERKGKN